MSIFQIAQAGRHSGGFLRTCKSIERAGGHEFGECRGIGVLAPCSGQVGGRVKRGRGIALGEALARGRGATKGVDVGTQLPINSAQRSVVNLIARSIWRARLYVFRKEEEKKRKEGT